MKRKKNKLGWVNRGKQVAQSKDGGKNFITYIKDDIAIFLLEHSPQFVEYPRHWIPELTRYVYCPKKATGDDCYICENYDNVASKGFIVPAYDIVEKKVLKLFCPTSVFSAICELAEEYGESIYETPLLIRKSGKGLRTKYNVIPKPGKNVSIPEKLEYDLDIETPDYDEQRKLFEDEDDDEDTSTPF